MSGGAPLYLDYAATTPVDAAVAQVMGECLTLAGTFGNAASAHAFGFAAARRVEAARAQVAALLAAAPEEIVFTSGATESNNLALLGVMAASAERGRHVVTLRTEHKAVLDPCRHIEKQGGSVGVLAEPAPCFRQHSDCRDIGGTMLQMRAQKPLGDGQLVLAQSCGRSEQLRIADRRADVFSIGSVGARPVIFGRQHVGER